MAVIEAGVLSKELSKLSEPDTGFVDLQNRFYYYCCYFFKGIFKKLFQNLWTSRKN